MTAHGGEIPESTRNDDRIPAFLSQGSGPHEHDPFTGRPAPGHVCEPIPGGHGLRVAPDGRLAQLVHLGEDLQPHWLCMTWPHGRLTANLYTEDEVAAWISLPLPAPEGTPPCCTPDRPHPAHG